MVASSFTVGLYIADLLFKRYGSLQFQCASYMIGSTRLSLRQLLVGSSSTLVLDQYKYYVHSIVVY